ncbi:MAG: M24 family metallopeptidase [Acidimicrobiales bacterium]
MNGLSENARRSRAGRMGRVRDRMADVGVAVLLLSHGADLPWLTGYEAMPLERLTMLVVPADGDVVLVVPALEAPRVRDAGELFDVRAWTEEEDPVAIVADIVTAATGGARLSPGTRLGISDRAWSVSLLALQACLPATAWVPASRVTAPVRAVKDPAEQAALRAAGAAADRVAAVLQSGGIPLVGRREADVSADLARRLVAEGHDRVNFAIVGSGPNAASPHHEPGGRVIGAGETVVCDFGGSLSLDGDVGYCSDITRTVVTGDPPSEVVECYEVLREAQEAATRAARAGCRAGAVDGVARGIISAAGLGDRFIHRTGHGIGIEEHEDPYLVAGNDEILAPGHAFSVEPGIYLPGRFGLRLEDIVVIDEGGNPESLNQADRSLVVVDA